jgi:peptidoglycan/LPS O-acetylase OafA/YrhL
MTAYVIQGKFWPLGPWGLNAASPWPRLTTLFLAGAAFDAYRDRVPRSSGLAIVALGVLGVLAMMPGWQMLALAMPVLGTYLLFYLASVPAPWLHRWGRRGDYSYGLYLHAFPVQQLIVRYVGAEHLTPVGLFAIALPITGLLALASWRFVESPFLRRKEGTGRASATPHGRPARAADHVQSAT